MDDRGSGSPLGSYSIRRRIGHMVGLWIRRRTWALVFLIKKKKEKGPFDLSRSVVCPVPLPIFINFLCGQQHNITSLFQPLFNWHLHIFTQAPYWIQNSFVYPSFLHVSVCDVLVSNVLGAPEYTLEFRTHYKTNRSIASFLCRTRGAREHMGCDTNNSLGRPT